MTEEFAKRELTERLWLVEPEVRTRGPARTCVAPTTWFTGWAPTGALTRTAATGAETTPPERTAPTLIPLLCAMVAQDSSNEQLTTIQNRRIAAPVRQQRQKTLDRTCVKPPDEPTQTLHLEGCAHAGVGFKYQTALGLAPTYPCDPLSPCWRLCYNLRAVERAAKEGATSVYPESPRVRRKPGAAVSTESASGREEASATSTNDPVGNAANHAVDPGGVWPAPHEDASRYCPVCSQRLLSRRCKLICTVCGYYMSCADYY